MPILVVLVVLVITEALLSVQPKSLKQQKDPQYLQKDIWCNRIRDHLYWVTDGSYNTMFLVTDKGVVAVDAPPTIGKNYLKAIAEVTNKPVTYVIYSHAHLDHIGDCWNVPKECYFYSSTRNSSRVTKSKKCSQKCFYCATNSHSYLCQELRIADWKSDSKTRLLWS